MVRLADAARLTLDGLPRDVDHRSALADQVVFVWKAMRQYAERNNWETWKYGGQAGHRGPFTMRYFLEQLFPGANKDELKTTQQIISSVLRQTGAAVCIYSPNATELQSGTKPSWYVSDTMPENLVVIATHHRPRTAGPPDRLTQVANKLTPHEAGEDREPAPVETRSLNQNTPEPAAAAERDNVVNEEFIQNIFEQVATCPVPITIPELSLLTDKPQWACRYAAESLVTDGKLLWRVESRAEKMVRGGGKMPPARPSRLYWPSPGPVPERTTLPPGIKPVKSSSDHAKERMAAVAQDDDMVYEFLRDADPKDRTSGKVAAATEMPILRVKASLQRLLAAKRLRVNSAYCYYHAEVKDRGRSAAPVPMPEMPAPVLPPTVPAPAPPESLTEQIHRLVDQLAQGDAVTENRILRARISVLEDQNRELVAKIAKFRSMLD